MRATSSFSKTWRQLVSVCSIRSNLSKHVLAVPILSFIGTCLISHFCGTEQHYYKVKYLQSEKEFKSHHQERRMCRCKNWNECWVPEQKDVPQIAGEAAKTVPGEAERQLPWRRAVNQFLAKLTFGFFRKWILWSCWSTVMSITCIKTSLSQNICCGQWKDSPWL